VIVAVICAQETRGSLTDAPSPVLAVAFFEMRMSTLDDNVTPFAPGQPPTILPPPPVTTAEQVLPLGALAEPVVAFAISRATRGRGSR
jgi:hypothetical protein